MSFLLDGSLQPIRGAHLLLSKRRKRDLKAFFPPKQMKEAAIAGLDVYGVENVQEVIDFLEGKGNLEPTTIDTRAEFYKDLDFQSLILAM
jgi:magnesium chelatase family protein